MPSSSEDSDKLYQKEIAETRAVMESIGRPGCGVYNLANRNRTNSGWLDAAGVHETFLRNLDDSIDRYCDAIDAIARGEQL